MKLGPNVALLMAALCLVPQALAGEGAEAQTDWPTGQANAGRTGSTGSDLGPGSGAVVWRFQANSLDVPGPPAVAHGRVYIGTGDGEVDALDARTGALIWKQDLGGRFEAGAAVANHSVYVPAASGRLYALEAANGDIRWTYELQAAVWTSPTVANGILYLGAGDGRLHAIDAESGAPLWTFNVSALGHRSGIGYGITGSPLALADLIYVAASDGRIYAFHAADGMLAWVHVLAEFADRVEGNLASDGRQTIYAVSGFGNLYALDATDGTTRWSHSWGVRNREPPMTLDGVVYRTGAAGVLALSSVAGSIEWEFTARSGLGLAATNSTVYVSDIDGGISALNRADGTLQWRRQAAGFIDTAPVIVDGTLYVGSKQFYVTALDTGAALPGQPAPERGEGDDSRLVSAPSASWVILVLLAGLGWKARALDGSRVR